MKKKVYTSMLIASHLTLGYSAVKCIKSIRKFKEAISKIDFPAIRKENNHLKDIVSSRCA